MPDHKIFQRVPYVCPKCGKRSCLSLRYDAYYCPGCDIWLEPVCGSPLCEFCAGRPERPSEAPGEE